MVVRDTSPAEHSPTRRRLRALSPEQPIADRWSTTSTGRPETRQVDVHRSIRCHGHAIGGRERRRPHQRVAPAALDASARSLREAACVRRHRRSAVRRKRSHEHRPRRGAEGLRVQRRMVLDSPRIESRPTCRQGLSRNRVPSRRGPRPTAWHITRAWLGAPQRSQTLVGRVPNKRLEPEANRISVRLCAGRRPGLAQQVLIDVQGLFHPYDRAISIWLTQSVGRGLTSLQLRPAATRESRLQSRGRRLRQRRRDLRLRAPQC